MKQIKIYAAIAVVGLALSACSSYSFTSRSVNVNRTDLYQSAMIVDVRPDFSKRIVTESSACKTAAQAMEEAKYLAVVNNKCDVIVDPVYKVAKTGSRYRASLTGFAGYYKNPRTLYEEINLLRDIRQEDVEKYLILKDPNIIGIMNPASPSEVINIFDGKAPCCKGKPVEEAPVVTEPAPAPEYTPAPAPAPASDPYQPAKKKAKKRK